MTTEKNDLIKKILDQEAQPDPDEAQRVPVQACPDRRGKPGTVAGTITWEEHELAWRSYSRRYGTSQSARRIAERGGFDWFELVDFLAREPLTWRPRFGRGVRKEGAQ